VAWVATHPTEGSTRIVGWYQHATVFAEYQPPPTTTARRLPHAKAPKFLIRAQNAVLLDRDERLFDVPRGTATTAGMGQSNIWYPDPHAASPILEYIAKGGQLPPRQGRSGKPSLQDVDRRIRIEKIAMNAAAAWFADRGYEVVDVSMDRLGWDLEARSKRSRLLIEVKGTSLTASDCVVEVTPDEYVKMTGDQHRPDYRLCVVTSCKSSPEAAVFAWSVDGGAWTTGAQTSTLKIEQCVAARISLKR
jgi:hypothetical protein